MAITDFVSCSGAWSIGADNATGLLSLSVTAGCAVATACGSVRISTVMLCSGGGGGDSRIGNNPTTTMTIRCNVTEITRLGLHVLFANAMTVAVDLLMFDVTVFGSIPMPCLILTLVAAFAIFRFRSSVITTLAISASLGVDWTHWLWLEPVKQALGSERVREARTPILRRRPQTRRVEKSRPYGVMKLHVALPNAIARSDMM